MSNKQCQYCRHFNHASWICAKTGDMMDAIQCCEEWQHYVGPDELREESEFLKELLEVVQEHDVSIASSMIDERLRMIESL